MQPKTKCAKCAAEILISTAERTGGLCMPCKQGWIKTPPLAYIPPSRHDSALDPELFRLFELAFLEFERNGKVSSVHCDKCGGLIEIRRMGIGSACSMNCECGKFKTTIRID